MDWVGLTTSTNEKKGVFNIDLVPGEYKLELIFPKLLNKNIFGSFAGLIVGGVKSLTLDGEEAEEAMQRGLPNTYADVNVSVQAPRYALLDVNSIMDLGLHDSFTQVFSVKENDMPAKLKIKLESHTTVKRLKLQGVLRRRDFAPSKRSANSTRSIPASAGTAKSISSKKLSEEGKLLIQEAYKTASESRTTLDSSVNPRDFLINFYKKYAPNKLADVDKVLNHFQGRTDDCELFILFLNIILMKLI